VIVDCTLGGGGHAEALLDAGCTVIGIDRDPHALAAAARLAGPRFTAVRARFSELSDVLDRLGHGQVDGVLADLGVSSPQLDEAARGFSFREAGPIDMRMDPDAPVSAADLVNGWSEGDLADVIWRYGEEKRSRAVAKAIVAGRPWKDTRALAEAIAKVVGRGAGRIHPATRTFQGIRIAVNDELGEVERMLPQAVARLAPGGRLAVIRTIRLREVRDVAPAPDDPNPRARSARLRTATRC
jgi:16S rRNA (cytosine1402-N4)-methyltransferase